MEQATESVAHCYVVVEGKFFAEGFILCVCRTKKAAVAKCRADGFSYHKKDDLWEGKNHYRRIEREDFYT